mmetsp:Transcript_4327/g.12201  ORF Transcript_4327/g.12201 Transcript_4327/m.12201 type:complete len:240 (+) Transcript_4327:82-801(+)
MPRQEEILVLYGSQTGNSEQAAIDLAEKAPAKLSNDEVTVTARHMQLDDFLEIERAKWSRLVVIITSSYGVGQAPLGCYKFRAMCDEIGKRKLSGMLDGVSYAMCGLGDSKYTTFFQNPSAINASLLTAGAWRAGLLGKADASGEGDDEQGKVIQRWVDTHWSKLARVLAEDPPEPEKLQNAQKKTLEICEEIFDDFAPAKKGFGGALAIVVPVVLAVVAGAFFSGSLDFLLNPEEEQS